MNTVMSVREKTGTGSASADHTYSEAQYLGSAETDISFPVLGTMYGLKNGSKPLMKTAEKRNDPAFRPVFN